MGCGAGIVLTGLVASAYSASLAPLVLASPLSAPPPPPPPPPPAPPFGKPFNTPLFASYSPAASASAEAFSGFVSFFSAFSVFGSFTSFLAAPSVLASVFAPVASAFGGSAVLAAASPAGSSLDPA